MYLTSSSQRPRRLRLNPTLRRMVRETELHPSDFIYPLFLVHGMGIRKEIGSMPNQFQVSIDEMCKDLPRLQALGIKAVLLFGIPAHKDAIGSENFDPNGIIQQGIRAIKAIAPDILVITDVCFCEYTDHGHCGLLNESQAHLPVGYVLNDESLEVLQKTAVSHAEAGADVVAPSGMLDGMVQALRFALDAAGFTQLPILSYSVKYASAFYGPFREAAEGAPKFGDRRSHQMEPANLREALKETALDVMEGADMLMVKPALAYLDVIHAVRTQFPALPLVAYNVSGEYAMIKAAAQNGWLDEQKVVLEVLTGIKRAGADLIISYHALDVAEWLKDL